LHITSFCTALVSSGVASGAPISPDIALPEGPYRADHPLWCSKYLPYLADVSDVDIGQQPPGKFSGNLIEPQITTDDMAEARIPQLVKRLLARDVMAHVTSPVHGIPVALLITATLEKAPGQQELRGKGDCEVGCTPRHGVRRDQPPACILGTVPDALDIAASHFR
jgi:hypothetical protein